MGTFFPAFLGAHYFNTTLMYLLFRPAFVQREIWFQQQNVVPTGQKCESCRRESDVMNWKMTVFLPAHEPLGKLSELRTPRETVPPDSDGFHQTVVSQLQRMETDNQNINLMDWTAEIMKGAIRSLLKGDYTQIKQFCHYLFTLIMHKHLPWNTRKSSFCKQKWMIFTAKLQK